MNSKRYILILFVVGLIIATFSISYTDRFEQLYIELFRIDTGIVTLDEQGEPHGEAIEYVNGKKAYTVSVYNGLREGWVTYYHPNGEIKNRRFCKNDIVIGQEKEFYEDGTRRYVANYKYGKPYGDLYWFFENGKMQSYLTHDILQQRFCEFLYDKSGKLTGMKGLMISPAFYSFDSATDSLVVMNEKNKFSNISDFYITVASPPGLDLRVSVTINKTVFKNPPIKNNTIKILQAFPKKGIYNIFIESHLYDKALKKDINGINHKAVIIKTI